MWLGFRISSTICLIPLVLLPLPGDTFSTSIFGIRFGSPKAPEDPCASAAEPERCHYDQAVNLLASMTTASSVSKELHIKSTAEQANAIVPAVETKLTPSPFLSLRVAGADAGREHAKSTPPPFGGVRITAATNADRERENRADLHAKEEQSVAILLALGALEGDDLPVQSLENATTHLEDALTQLQPGALTTFRMRRLAEAMNHHGPPKPAEQRAFEALSALEQVNWSPHSVVVDVIQDLQSTNKTKSISLFQWVQATNAASGGQLFILLVFVLGVLIIDTVRVAQDVAVIPQHQEQGYGAMGHTPVRH